MADFAYMDNMLDFDQTVDKVYSCIDHSDLMSWFDQTQQEDGGYDGLFSSFLDANSPLELKEEELQNLLHEEGGGGGGGRLSPTTAAVTTLSPETAVHIPKYKKRRNQQKRVVQHVKVEEVSSDLWAWRKYGQKPIKGSCFPRSYYRCSSSKGCIARKLVERSNSDPETFIVTYTGEHSHSHPTRRSSLAGSTRSSSSSSKTPSPSTRQTLAEEVAEPSKVISGGDIQEVVFSDEMVMEWGEMEMADQWPWILP